MQVYKKLLLKENNRKNKKKICRYKLLTFPLSSCPILDSIQLWSELLVGLKNRSNNQFVD
jgi:hypothetical protein